MFSDAYVHLCPYDMCHDLSRIVSCRFTLGPRLKCPSDVERFVTKARLTYLGQFRSCTSRPSLKYRVMTYPDEAQRFNALTEGTRPHCPFGTDS